MRSQKQPLRALSGNQATRFRWRLLVWYDAHARALPWREIHDPYRVWLSEVMLQQTRVAAVIGHYHEFLHRFPTVDKLAAAREASVLAAWSGLGYYRRARMLHAAAKVVVRELAGKFAETSHELQQLPGIGRYTAAAIASIAFGQPVAVVDGNVERVLQRVSGVRLAGEELWQAAESLLDRTRPGEFNQAMMELGATVCTPRAPGCLTCPIVELCATRGELAASATAAPQKKREIHYALHLRESGRGGEVFLVQRPRDTSLMAGMWELPELEGAPSQAREKQIPRFSPNDEAKGTINGRVGLPLFTLRHSITVTAYTVRVWRSVAPDRFHGKWISLEHLEQVALTGLARKILRRAGLHDPRREHRGPLLAKEARNGAPGSVLAQESTRIRMRRTD